MGCNNAKNSKSNDFDGQSNLNNSQIDPEEVCIICFKKPKDARRCMECRQPVCLSCGLTWVRFKNQCPLKCQRFHWSIDLRRPKRKTTSKLYQQKRALQNHIQNNQQQRRNTDTQINVEPNLNRVSESIIRESQVHIQQEENEQQQNNNDGVNNVRDSSEIIEEEKQNNDNISTQRQNPHQNNISIDIQVQNTQQQQQNQDQQEQEQQQQEQAQIEVQSEPPRIQGFRQIPLPNISQNSNDNIRGNNRQRGQRIPNCLESGRINTMHQLNQIRVMHSST